MDIILPPELERFVKERVESGRYDTSDEVVQVALWLLREREELNRIRLEELRKEIAIGVEQADRGEVAPLDMEAIKAAARQRVALEKGGADGSGSSYLRSQTGSD